MLTLFFYYDHDEITRKEIIYYTIIKFTLVIKHSTDKFILEFNIHRNETEI